MEVKRRDAQNNSQKRPAVARFAVHCTFPQLTKYFNDMRQITLKVMNDDRNGEPVDLLPLHNPLLLPKYQDRCDRLQPTARGRERERGGKRLANK